jgi:hypothetical protein
MKKWVLGVIWVGFMGILACGTSEEAPETPIDAGRAFISAIYNGNFKRAKKLVVDTEPTLKILEESIEKDFRSRDGFQKEALSKASIQIIKIETRDSVNTIVQFLNAYSGKPAAIEVVKNEGIWQINLENFKP